MMQSVNGMYLEMQMVSGSLTSAAVHGSQTEGLAVCADIDEALLNACCLTDHTGFSANTDATLLV